MSDNIQGTHVQGVSDEGNPVEDGFPVVVAFEDASGNKEVPNIGPNGGVLTEPASGGAAQHVIVDSGTVTANQGAPNTPANAWPVGIGGSQNFVTATTVFTAPGQTLTLDVRGYGGATIQLTGDVNWSGTISFVGSSDGTNYIALFGAEQDAQQQVVTTYDDHSSLAGAHTVIRRFEVSGLRSIQAQASFVNAGTITCVITAAPADGKYPALTNPNDNTIGSSLPQMAVYGKDQGSNNFRLLSMLTSFVYSFGSKPLLQVANVPYKVNSINQNYDADKRVTTFKSVQATAAGSTALWTPAAGKKFRLMRWIIEVTDNATLAVAGVLTIKLLDAAGDIAQNFDIFVPAAALNSSGLLGDSKWNVLDNGILSAAANNVLNVNLSAALVTGNVRVRCCGTEE